MESWMSHLSFLKNQLDCVFNDIYPDAIKIGMVSNVKLIEVIAERLKLINAKNIVVDPVMISTSGSRLLEAEARQTLMTKLIPLATVITPNIPEAEVLSGMKISTVEDMENAAAIIAGEYDGAVLVKGGHSLNDANDLLYWKGEKQWFYGERIDNPNTHGTGCTLSSAIASNLAKGFSLLESVKLAKDYISGALKDKSEPWKRKRPVDHTYNI